MSTRGAIAVGTSDKWRGLYQHSDSYPTCLGREVWAQLKELGPEEFVKRFIDVHPGGWSSFPEVCYCHDEDFAKRDGSIVKDSPHYKEDAPDGRLDSDNPDPLFIEWVYIVNVENRDLIILEHVSDKKTKGSQPVRPVQKRRDGYWDYGHCAFKHKVRKVIDLDGEEPVWGMVER